MENTARAAMVPADMGWSDIGNWAALAEALADGADAAGNVVRGGADLAQCEGVLAMSDGPRISAVGLRMSASSFRAARCWLPPVRARKPSASCPER